jgi:hypothetical protein
MGTCTEAVDGFRVASCGVLLQYYSSLHHLGSSQSRFGTLAPPAFSTTTLIHLQLRVYVPFLDDWATASPHSFSLISGVLPPAVSGFFGFFLPIIMRWLTRVSQFVCYAILSEICGSSTWVS